MRAREFITEQLGQLPDSQGEPLQHTYFIPGIKNNDAYHTYRLSVAIARARADAGGYGKDMPEFASVSAFGQNAIVAGFNDNVEAVLKTALVMTDTPGGLHLVGSKESNEPKHVNQQSVTKPFQGYPR
jgi:hypothetical protein